MSKSINSERIKHVLYLISMGILIFFSTLILIQSTSNDTGMNFFQQHVSKSSLTLGVLFGAALLILIFCGISRFFSALSEEKLLRFTLLFSGIGIFLQYFILFYIQPILRYDHLLVFDGALEIIQTGKLSLSANDTYFGLYPFNISIAALNSLILRILQLFGMAEKHLMLGLQCTYLFLIDLGIFFSWKIVKILHSTKSASLFALLCLFNPILYACAAGCYTTTLMVPLLMGTLLLMICFLKETDFRKKCILGFLSGAALAFGSRLRATVFIAGIALVIYLMIRVKPSVPTRPFKKTALLIGTVLLGCAVSFGGFTAFQNSYVTEDYTDTQMPIIYYLMFAANPDTEGTYNEADYELVSHLNTLEEKETVSAQLLKERLQNMGIGGFLALANHKLELTWCDATDDYSDFLTTSRNYSGLQSFMAGDQKDFYAMYCHMFQVAIMVLLLISCIHMLKKKCDHAYYLLLLTLLGGMVFHILWESYYVYSFGFSMLLLIAVSDGIEKIADHPVSNRKLGIAGVGFLAIFLITTLPWIYELRSIPYKHVNNAVVQDMSLGEQQPLLSGDEITQTFRTDQSFNRVACKIYNPSGTANDSQYRLELFTENGDCLARMDIQGSQIQDKDYCYLEVPKTASGQMKQYLIRITPLYTTPQAYLTFGYYHTQHYDIYSEGHMTGLNSDERTDLTFKVFESVETNFFQ